MLPIRLVVTGLFLFTSVHAGQLIEGHQFLTKSEYHAQGRPYVNTVKSIDEYKKIKKNFAA